MVYQGFSEPSRKVGPFVVALLGGILAMLIMIYPMVDLVKILVVYGLNGYGWMAFCGCVGQILTGIVAGSLGRIKYSTWVSMKGCIITSLVLHIIFGMMFLIIAFLIEYPIWVVFAIISMGSGIAAFICLLFLYPKDENAGLIAQATGPPQVAYAPAPAAPYGGQPYS